MGITKNRSQEAVTCLVSALCLWLFSLAGFDNTIVSCPTERPMCQETECAHRELNLANSLMKRCLPS